jgi:hypothetical protein
MLKGRVGVLQCVGGSALISGVRDEFTRKRLNEVKFLERGTLFCP